jgi:hypothetical protein
MLSGIYQSLGAAVQRVQKKWTGLATSVLFSWTPTA